LVITGRVGFGESLLRGCRALAQGKIVALKGIGGFQLLVDARNSSAVVRLRERKQREHKPFAMLMPSLECVRRYCEVNAEEEKPASLCGSTHRPSAAQGDAGDLAPEVAQHSSCSASCCRVRPFTIC
jgi:hydrogenase maturation protein HypF